MTALRSHRMTGRRDEGATAVEVGLVLPVVITAMFFVLYGALFFFYSAIADHVARSEARHVSIPMGKTGTAYPDATPGAVATDAKHVGGSLLPNPTTVAVTTSPSSATPREGDLVTVTVTYRLPVLSQLSSVIPGLSGIDTISRSATERRQ